MLSAVWHDPPGSRFARVPWLGRFMERVEHGIEWLHAFYGEILEWALGHRKTVLAIAARHVPRELRDRAAGRHRVRPAGGRGLHLAAAQHAGRLEPRVHGQQGAAGRGRAQGVPGHRADDDHRRDRRRAATTRGSTSSSPIAPSARGRRRRSRRRSAKELKPIPGHRARVRLRPAGVGQPARPRSRDADDADQRIREEGREGAGHRRPRDVREGRGARAVDPAQQRCRGGRRHQRAAGRRDDPAAARRRHGELLARARRPELRGQRAVAEGQPPARRAT